MPTSKQAIVVDDDQTLFPPILKRMWMNLNIPLDLTFASTAQEVFINRENPFDLLLLDLMFYPRSGIIFENIDMYRTGIEFLRRLRAGEYEQFGFPATIPVIVATAHVIEMVGDDLLRLNTPYYLGKPFSLEDLRSVMQMALNE